MSKQIMPTLMARIRDGQVLVAPLARYQDSAPFAGTFQVFDLDHCFHQKEDGRLFATVMCGVDGDASADEDSSIDIELLATHQGVIGGESEVIRRIAVLQIPQTINTVFATLFDLAMALQTEPRHAHLTRHHLPDADAVRLRLQKAILQDVMPGEAATSRWQRLRIFCFNHINRAQPAVKASAIRDMLHTIEAKHPTEGERIQALAQVKAAQLQGSRPQEFIQALARILDPHPKAALGQMNYLDWLDERWTCWSAQSVQHLSVDALLQDIDLLSHNPETKIPGMGLPLAANFMADMGLGAFAKPDLHVMPIIGLLQLSIDRRDEDRQAFGGLIKIAQIEDRILHGDARFEWLQAAGGLKPRFLDRLIYLIGSDNFHLDGVKNKRHAPQRRLLMRQALLQGGLLDGRYC